jgi:hypothetical protein
MPPTDDAKPSFSSGRRWLGVLNTAVSAAAALALVVMANYLASGHFVRFHVSRDAPFKLSRQTKAVLESLTNEVRVTIFFDPKGANQEIYGLTQALLTEYQNANPRHIHLRPLDYNRYAGEAKDLLLKHNLNGPHDKDFVLFESNGHSKIVYANQLADYDFSELLAGRSKFVRRSAFKGEMLFTSDIYAVSNPQALKAYFLYGHGENDPGPPSGESETLGHGCTNLAAILQNQIDCDWDRLSLRGTNDVPKDCQLLIVAGPRGQFLSEEVTKIAAYLKNGGRLLALLPTPCGLEPMLEQNWGVRLGNSPVVDMDSNYNIGPGDFLTKELIPHAIINPLAKDLKPLRMSATRPVSPAESVGKIPGAPEVNFLAATSTNAVDEDHHSGRYFLLAAIEQGVIKGVETPRGEGTHIVLAGDSFFLSDSVIESSGNYQFAFLALTWLLQRPPLMLANLLPQPIKEYRLYLTPDKSADVRWLFLAGLPASILILGGLVWLRRRH